MKRTDQNTDDLYQAFLCLRTTDEVRRFLRDLMTEEEIDECTRRWQAARLLDAGQSYEMIQKTTKLSSTTVARISRWLRKGMEGYRLVIDRLHHTSPSREKRLV
jgi:TrpR-related protein YerC/YecD